MEQALKAHEASSDPYGKLRLCSRHQGRLIDMMRTLLTRRLWLAERLEMPDVLLASGAGVKIGDMLAFLRDDAMDKRIAELLPGLALCRIPEDSDKKAGEGVSPAAFALLKASLTLNKTLRCLVKALPEDQQLKRPAGLVAQLAAGNHGNRAVVSAWCSLRNAGVPVEFTLQTLPKLAGIDAQRAAAALLIPLRFGASHALLSSITVQPEPTV